MLEFALFLFFPAAMALAGSMDFFTMTIPNRITVGLVIGFVVVLPFAPPGWWGLASHLAAFALMLVIGIFMFSQGWCGGGDAKLLAATALWLGLERLLDYLVIVSIAGGVLVFALLMYRAASPPLFLLNQRWAMRLHEKAGGVPYGIALAIGGLWIYPTTTWLSQLAV
ncbi:MAG: prepilin peptidase [Hyphomicrobiaceae bacterium]